MEKQVIQSTGFRNIKEDGKVVGFQVKIRLPYYRGVFLSQIKCGNLTVDDQVFTPDQIIWRINGENYTVDEMKKDWKTHWHPMELATLIIKKEGGLAQGYHDVTMGYCVTHSYMPPFMEQQSDPNKPEFVYMPEMGHNLNSRRMLIV